MCWRSGGDGQFVDNLREVIPIASFHRGKRDIRFRNLPEHPCRGVEGDMRPVEADCEEKGFIVLGGNLFDCPVSVGTVLKEVFLVSLWPEVPEPFQVLDEPDVPLKALPRTWTYNFEVSWRKSRAMVDFACCKGEVSIGSKVARKRHVIFQSRDSPRPGSIHVDPRSRGS